MELFFIIFGAMVLVILAMSVGVIFSNKPIKGSCGGMSALGMEVACDICGGDKSRCENGSDDIESEDESEQRAYYDASKFEPNASKPLEN